jgi:hypothetical protein
MGRRSFYNTTPSGTEFSSPKFCAPQPKEKDDSGPLFWDSYTIFVDTIFFQWIYRIIVSCSRKVFESISGWLKVFDLRLVEGLSVIEGLFKLYFGFVQVGLGFIELCFTIGPKLTSIHTGCTSFLASSKMCLACGHSTSKNGVI